MPNGSDTTARPPRNLVLCCDGTNNQFGLNNTNVIRLVQVLERDTDTQRVYYDPGVGTFPEPEWTSWVRHKITDVLGLAVGLGLNANVLQAYAYLMDTWEPEDRVFLFGFSRGAYTVRVLAGLLHAFGLMPRGGDNMVPYLMRLYQSVRGNPSYWKLCDDYRWTFARPGPGATDDRRFRVHFVGVWDTVSSVGWMWEPKTFPYTAGNPSITSIRHAVAVDERRAFFRQNLMRPEPADQDLKQYWFPGVHSDVGGGYEEKDGGLWRIPFRWMVDEAKAAGLQINPNRWNNVWNRSPVPERPWAEEQHESLTLSWWPAEFYPKVPAQNNHFPWLHCNRGRPRYIPAGAPIHQSTLQRIRDRLDYNPPNFSPAFLARIRAMETVPETLPFEI